MGLARLPGRLMAIYAAQQVRHARNRAPAFSREWRGPTEPKESRRLLIVTWPISIRCSMKPRVRHPYGEMRIFLQGVGLGEEKMLRTLHISYAN